ncbi:MAG TPA: Spi family protease inhibitor, partial [Candidatus Cloacimonadota bacterium]|nr:Spi family protease inhibitor [Candidatus Cloacimonadota bacterium]
MKRICLVLFILILLQCGYAATVTQSEATQLGTDFISSLGNSGFTFRSSEAYIGSYSQGDPDFYILRFEPTGFALVAAEEQSIPILGYSLTNAFPEGDMPDHVRWYLDFYS